MLSAQELQRLTDIERHLRASDPDLARALSRGLRRSLLQRAVAALRKRPGSA
ncbi:DUF3040 domain-containing protein [Lentzea sp. NPDC003310]|uniref:DUF3040 domain-containing protein n=1 Tax=Lentzea sp. NPDC003310 TaxID=3154447 RepID=UPI0033BAECCC